MAGRACKQDQHNGRHDLQPAIGKERPLQRMRQWQPALPHWHDGTFAPPSPENCSCQQAYHQQGKDIVPLRRHILDGLLRVRRQNDLQEARIEHTMIMYQREDIDQNEQTAEHGHSQTAHARQECAKHRQKQGKPRHAQHAFQKQQHRPLRQERFSLIQIELDQLRHIRQAKPEKQTLRKVSPGHKAPQPAR